MRSNEQTAQAEALEKAILGIQRQFGAGSIQRLDGSVADKVGDPISTGSLGLDLALGVGGIPRGRMVEIYGPEASGKTTLALQAIASAQALGGTAAMIDAEHAMDPGYAANLGVDLPKLLVSQPDSGEQALEIAEQLVRSSAVDLVVIDSVAALVPEAEISGQMGDLQVGLQARMMSKAMRKLTSVISKTRCTVIFINQMRVGVYLNDSSPLGVDVSGCKPPDSSPERVKPAQQPAQLWVVEGLRVQRLNGTTFPPIATCRERSPERSAPAARAAS